MKTISPKPNCNRCYGRGYIGTIGGEPIPCLRDKNTPYPTGCSTNKGINKDLSKCQGEKE
jgi:hypothetical protein